MQTVLSDLSLKIIVPAAGIVLVLLGSWCVAYEVVNRFRGASHDISTGWGGTGKAEKSASYTAWESRRNVVMWIGLALISIGSLLQLWGLFLT
jgi:hypothetical protein